MTAYRARFHDVSHWEPYVRQAAALVGLPCRDISATLPGSYPTFQVDGRIFKFFGELFDGIASHAVERQVFAMLDGLPELPVPRRIAEGVLYPQDDRWRWPFLVMTRVPGISLGEGRAQLAAEERIGLATRVGCLVRQLHATPIATPGPLKPDWRPFLAFMREQRAKLLAQHADWGLLTPTMMAELEGYVPEIEALVDTAVVPRLLHADITADHLLGTWTRPHRLHGLIDMGDACVGDPFYELPALHLSAFDCDKRMLRAFCDAYGLEQATKPGFARKAMSYTLLHEFDVLAEVMERPGARDLSLMELGRRLWDLQSPGF